MEVFDGEIGTVFFKSQDKTTTTIKLASIVPIAPDVAMPSMPPKATAGARQAKNRKNTEDSTCIPNVLGGTVA